MNDGAPGAAIALPDTGLLARKGAARPALRPEDIDRASADDAAITLRLDPDRQRRLSLACAVAHLSPDRMIARALDALLDTLDTDHNPEGSLP